MSRNWSTLGAFNIGGTNATGQVPVLLGRFHPIDPDTPHDAYTIASPYSPSNQLELVFSDEFNTPGRTFYPGDDPYWEAVDLHYWATNNLEWYDPAAVTTTPDGALTITLQQKDTHDLNYQGGMIQTWNKFCFTGGYVVANVSLPGVSNVQGLWPALWMMGNLGRAGYGATLEGLWPYSYDSCDVGTVANQSVNGVPPAASVNGDKAYGGVLSYLPGQRLSRCTCKDAPDGSKGSRLDHPGPKHSTGEWVGRAAPEIDIFEAQVTTSSPSEPGVLTGQVSQSAQWAPFDAGYIWGNATYGQINDPEHSVLNTFIGSATQQATSVVSDTNSMCYEYPNPLLIPPPMPGTTEDPDAVTVYGQNTGCYSVYGVEYQPGFDDAWIHWVNGAKDAWTLMVQGVGADEETMIGPRSVSQEPMYIIANLGMSHNFGTIDLAHIPFPVHLKIDWVRVYQPSDAKNIGCDPEDFPTADYIERYIEAYTNPNLTTWRGDYGQVWPGNSFLGQCD
ncbi:glycoside hydrolase family 16 protein [Cytidiella melzeri]|nr:glycoside hydrolase family 16 protein [Cytidiella melzeri]